MEGGGGYGSTADGGPRRDLGKARSAYASKNVELSISAHANKAGDNEAEEGHRMDGDMLKSAVYGGLDGVLTAFAIVSGAAGGQLSTTTVLVLGASNIVADAFAMGVGDVVSTLAYYEHVAQERRREVWEFENYPEGEVEEMVELYEARGLPRAKAETVVTTMSKYPEFFIDVMMSEELELRVPKEDDNPYFDGFVTFASFLVFGSVPLMSYVLLPAFMPDARGPDLFKAACAGTMAVLFALGCFKSTFSTSSWWASGLEFLVLGSAAASTSYFIGAFVKDVADIYLHSDGDTALIGGL